MHTHIHTHIYTNMHAYIHTYIHTCIHTRKTICIYTEYILRTHTYIYMPPCNIISYIYIHTYIHTYTLIYILIFLIDQVRRYVSYAIEPSFHSPFNRCSDILSLQGWKYGFNNFHIYTELLSPIFSNDSSGSSGGGSGSSSSSSSSSSGGSGSSSGDIFILSDDELRSNEGEYCGVMLGRLVSFLAEQFPSAEISLRRGGWHTYYIYIVHTYLLIHICIILC